MVKNKQRPFFYNDLLFDSLDCMPSLSHEFRLDEMFSVG